MARKRKRRRLRLAVLIVIVLLVCVLVPYVYSRLVSPWRAISVHQLEGAQADAAPRADGRLHLLAFNIAHGRGATAGNWGSDKAERAQRLADMARFIRDADVDIVVLNEIDFDSTWSHGVNYARALAEATGLSYWVEQRSIDLAMPFFRIRFGNAVLSRYPIEAARLLDLPGYARWETVVGGKKKAAVCTIAVTPDRLIDVVPVHFEPRSATVRVDSARIVEDVARTSSHPVVAMGDFNCGLPTPAPSSGKPTGQTAVSLLLDSELFATVVHQPPGPADMTFPSISPSSQIDWILVPPDWRIIHRQVPAGELSDHLPVILRVQMPGP